MAMPATLDDIMNTLRAQELTLRQLQATLDRLMSSGARGPEGRGPALASVAVMDPARAGFSLSQRDLAERLGLPPSYVSALVRAFKLDDDTEVAMVVRPGAKRLVNFHHRAIERFVALLESPPEGLDARTMRVIEQARHRRTEVARAA